MPCLKNYGDLQKELEKQKNENNSKRKSEVAIMERKAR